MRESSDDQDNQTPVRLVSCPCCKGDSVYSLSNPYRPFCSARCKNMDFGAWADESFRMPESEDPEGLMSSPDPRLQ